MAGNKMKISNVNGLPQMSNAFDGWEIAFYADYIFQVMVNNAPVDMSKTVKITGTMQPLRAEEVELKPEGQRSWSWCQIHVRGPYKALRIQQILNIGGVDYKVMAMKDYSLCGYNEYHVIRDYEGVA